MLTRRQVLELGAGACLVAILGHVRSASAAEADATVADYLRREPWLPLVGGNVDVEPVTLRLAEVADLPARRPGRRIRVGVHRSFWGAEQRNSSVPARGPREL